MFARKNKDQYQLKLHLHSKTKPQLNKTSLKYATLHNLEFLAECFNSTMLF